MNWISRFLVCCAVLPMVAPSYADSDEDYEPKQWQEAEVVLPASPRQESLLPVQVSAATDNQFFVDSATVSVGAEGIVRYVLVVLSREGARNVSFEGIRCETRERRIYAFGRQDGSWSKSKSDKWVRILDVYANRHHAALFLDYFCPGGVIVRDADEARNALRQGGHPDNKRW